MIIGIVIVNWNGGKDTLDCLKSLQKLDLSKDRDVRVVIVDNASTDDSVKKIKEYIDNHRQNHPQSTFHCIENKTNSGFTGGNNIGMKLLHSMGADYILLLNNDTTVHPAFLKHLTDSSKKHNAEIIGPKIYFSKGYEFHSTYKKEELGKVIWYAGGIIDWDNIYCSHRGVDEVDHGQFDTPSETPFVTGCCMLISRNVIEKIGYLNEDYFAYLEDVDYCMRAKKSGFRLFYEPGAVIWHKNAQSSGKSGSSLHQYYQTRNRLLFGMTYASLRTKAALLRESMRMRSNEPTKQAVLDFYFHRYGKKR